MYMAKKERNEPEFDVEEIEEAFDNISDTKKSTCKCTSESIGTCHY